MFKNVSQSRQHLGAKTQSWNTQSLRLCAFAREKLKLLKEMKVIAVLIILPTFYNKIKITFTKNFLL
jgi:hypothetical protein